jgi:hypothetical protein
MQSQNQWKYGNIGVWSMYLKVIPQKYGGEKDKKDRNKLRR